MTMKNTVVSGIRENINIWFIQEPLPKQLKNWFKKLILGRLLEIAMGLLHVTWFCLAYLTRHYSLSPADELIWRSAVSFIYSSSRTHLQMEWKHDLLVLWRCKKDHNFSWEKLAANLMPLLGNKSYLLEITWLHSQDDMVTRHDVEIFPEDCDEWDRSRCPRMPW